MLFTNNIIFLMILLFFALYFLIFNTKFVNLKFKNARVYFIAIYSAIFYATWYPPAILLLIYYAFITNKAKILCITAQNERERERERERVKGN